MKKNFRSTGVRPVRQGLANEEVVNGKCERCGSGSYEEKSPSVDVEDHQHMQNVS